MRITLAQAMGTCFGVQDAIDLALDPQFKDRLTVVGQLVHNPQVTERLSTTELDGLFDLDYHFKRIDVIFDRIFGATD